jgi:hypothetical protein
LAVVVAKAIEYGASEFPPYFVKLLNEFALIHPSLLRLGRIVSTPTTFADRFGTLGGLVVQVSLLLAPDLSEAQRMELIETANLFIELTKSVSGENDLHLHRQSLLAAFDCSQQFKYHITNHYDTILSDINEFIPRISTVMRDIIGTVKRREQYPSSRCIGLAQLEAEPF